MKLRNFNIEKNTDDPAKIADLKAKGFVEVKDEKPSKDLSKLTKADLVEMAEDQGVENAKSMKKDELIKALQ